VTGPEIASDGIAISAANGKGKLRLIQRDDLDGRTRARRQFDAIAEGVADDLKGTPGGLSTVKLHLIEAFAGLAIATNALNARLLAGEEVEISDLAQAASTLARVAMRIGTERIAKEISTFGSLIRADQERQRRQTRAQRQQEADAEEEPAL
jgi:hypothetical protein